MEPGSYAVVGASMLQQRRLEIVANNLAQVNTPGYKADVPVFRIEKTSKTAGQGSALGDDVVQQSAWRFTHINYKQGSFRKTNNPLDLALNGDGFFVLRSPGGLRYSRAGQFGLNRDGVMIANQGWPVLGVDNGEIRVPNASSQNSGIFINQTGQVYSNGEVVGQVQIIDFPKPYALEKRGFSSFSTVVPGQATFKPESTDILQGYIEGSNVNAIAEMVKLIEIGRLYETYQKTIKTFDSIDDRAVNDLGRVEEIQ